MYTTPFASLRVPEIDDVDINQGLINLATDIQFRAEANAARLAEVQRRRGVGLANTSSTALANGAVVAVPFNSETWDSDGYFNPGSNTIVTLTRGLWRVYASAQLLGSGTLSWALMDVTGSTYGAVFAKQTGAFAASVSSTANLAGSGIFYTAGETITMHVLQSSGGAGSIILARMYVMRLGRI